MKTTPKVSVIVATFNAEKFIGYAIQSVLNQTFSDFELLVIGDGCTDNTAQILKNFSDARVHWYNLPKNTGSQGMPNNEGLKRAKGQYITYLNHDDLWFPWHLENLMAYIGLTDYDWVHASGFALYPNDKIEFISSLPTGFDFQSYFIGPSSWLHKRGVVEAAGNWPHHSHVPTPIDQDLQIRIAEKGFKMVSTREISVLEFYAAAWKMLSKKTTLYPQKEYLDAMMSNAEALQLRLLKQVADLYGQETHSRYWGGFSGLESLKMLIWRPFRRFVIFPSQNKIQWFRKIMIWKRLRYRKQRAKQTGEAEHKTIHLNLNH